MELHLEAQNRRSRQQKEKKTANPEALPYPLLNQLQIRIVNADNAQRAPHSSRQCEFPKFSLDCHLKVGVDI